MFMNSLSTLQKNLLTNQSTNDSGVAEIVDAFKDLTGITIESISDLILVRDFIRGKNFFWFVTNIGKLKRAFCSMLS